VINPAPTAEHWVLSCVLQDNQCFEVVSAALKPQLFTGSQTRTIFKAMLAMRKREPQCPLDLVTVMDWLENAEGVDAATYQGLLGEMVQAPVQATNISSYCYIIRENAGRRSAANRLASEAEKLSVGEESITSSAQNVAQHLLEISRQSEGYFLPDLDMELSGLLKRIEGWNAGTETVGVQTGISLIDSKMLGLRRESLTILGARTSGGKSALAQTIAATVCSRGGHVVYLSPEMSRTSLFLRFLAMLTGINPQCFQSKGGLRIEEWPSIIEGCSAIGKWNLCLNDDPFITAQEATMRALLAREQMGGLDLVVVDYLQVMSHQGQQNPQRHDLAVKDTLLGLVSLSRQLKVPVLALSQFNREANDDEPRVTNLKESSSIEQLADAVLLLHRPKDDPLNAKLILAKNREGPVGEEALEFDPNTTFFRSKKHMQVT